MSAICIPIKWSTVQPPIFFDTQRQDAIFMPEFSSSKTTLHHFHVDYNEGDSGIGYNMIIFRSLMLQLGLSEEFKHQVLQWDGSTVPMK